MLPLFRAGGSPEIDWDEASRLGILQDIDSPAEDRGIKLKAIKILLDLPMTLIAIDMEGPGFFQPGATGFPYWGEIIAARLLDDRGREYRFRGSARSIVPGMYEFDPIDNEARELTLVVEKISPISRQKLIPASIKTISLMVTNMGKLLSMDWSDQNPGLALKKKGGVEDSPPEEPEKDAEGRWFFKFSVDTRKRKKCTRSLNLDKKIPVPGGNLETREMLLGFSRWQLNYSIEETDDSSRKSFSGTVGSNLSAQFQAEGLRQGRPLLLAMGIGNEKQEEVRAIQGSGGIVSLFASTRESLLTDPLPDSQKLYLLVFSAANLPLQEPLVIRVRKKDYRSGDRYPFIFRGSAGILEGDFLLSSITPYEKQQNPAGSFPGVVPFMNFQPGIMYSFMDKKGKILPIFISESLLMDEKGKFYPPQPGFQRKSFIHNSFLPFLNLEEVGDELVIEITSIEALFAPPLRFLLQGRFGIIEKK